MFALSYSLESFNINAIFIISIPSTIGWGYTKIPIPYVTPSNSVPLSFEITLPSTMLDLDSANVAKIFMFVASHIESISIYLASQVS